MYLKSDIKYVLGEHSKIFDVNKDNFFVVKILVMRFVNVFAHFALIIHIRVWRYASKI